MFKERERFSVRYTCRVSAADFGFFDGLSWRIKLFGSTGSVGALVVSTSTTSTGFFDSFELSEIRGRPPVSSLLT